MPTYRDETQHYHRERVREVLALQPTASTRTIREALQADPNAPLTLDRSYLDNLRRKIEGERRHRYDRAEVAQRLAELQDRTETIIAQMWRILLKTTAEPAERIAAARTIIDAEHRFLEAQMNAGIFERNLGTLDVAHTLQLTPEYRALILRAFANYGLVIAHPPEPAPILEPPRTATAPSPGAH